jgi:hypothetical protein
LVEILIRLLGEALLYWDTDRLTPSELKLRIGDFFGSITTERAECGHTAYIKEFVPGGTKNCAFTYSPTTAKEVQVMSRKRYNHK